MQSQLLALALLTCGVANAQIPVQAAHGRIDDERGLKLTSVRDILQRDLLSGGVANGTTLLTARAPIHVRPKQAEPKSTEPTPVVPNSDDPKALADRAVALQDIVGRWIQPPLVANDDVLRITGDGTLIANLRSEQQAWLDRFLALQREPNCMLDTQFRILSGPRGCFERFLPKGETSVLSEEASLAFLRDVNGAKDVEIAHAPHLISYPRSYISISVANAFNYVEDWTIEIIEPGHRELAVPHVATVMDGLEVGLRAVMLTKTRAGLELAFTQSKVVQPIETKQVPLGRDGKEVEVGLPVVNRVNLETKIELESGSSALLSAPSVDRDRDVAVLVSFVRRDGPPPSMEPETTITASPPKQK